MIGNHFFFFVKIYQFGVSGKFQFSLLTLPRETIPADFFDARAMDAALSSFAARILHRGVHVHFQIVIFAKLNIRNPARLEIVE
jgi:hypothetical protein